MSDNLHYSCSFLDFCANELTSLFRSRHLVYCNCKLSSTRFALRDCIIDCQYGIRTRVSGSCVNTERQGGHIDVVDIWKCSPQWKENSAHLINLYETLDQTVLPSSAWQLHIQWWLLYVNKVGYSSEFTTSGGMPDSLAIDTPKIMQDNFHLGGHCPQQGPDPSAPPMATRLMLS